MKAIFEANKHENRVKGSNNFCGLHLNWKFIVCKCNLAYFVVLFSLHNFIFFAVIGMCRHNKRLLLLNLLPFTENPEEFSRFQLFKVVKRKKAKKKNVYLSSDLINQDFKNPRRKNTKQINISSFLIFR